MNYLKISGNALMEYTLSFGLLILIGILTASLTDLSEALRNSFSNTMNGRQIGNSISVSHFSRDPWTGGNQVLTQETCFNSGICIDLPIIPEDGLVSETAGSLGGDLTKKIRYCFATTSKTNRRRP